MIFSNQKFGIQNNLFHFSIARFVHPVIRLAGNSNSEVVGADTNMRGVDVSAEGGNNGVVNSLQERSLDSSLDIVNQGSLDGRVVDQGSRHLRSRRLSLGLTLGDVRHNGSGESGVVDMGKIVGQGSLDGRVVDQRSLDGRVVDQRFVEGEGVCVNNGSLDGRVVDDGLVNTSGDQGRDQGRVVDSGS